MNIKFQKQLFTLGTSAFILINGLIDSVSAVTLNYSGRFADEISCSIEGPPSNRRCDFEDLEGGSFSGFLELDESGARLGNTAPPRLNLFNKAGNNINQQIFIVSGINFNQNIANLSLQNFLDPTYEELLTVSFQAPGVTNITEPFGAFISGNYRKREGLSRRISQSINIVSATVTPETPSKVPEGSLILGIFSCFGLSWLLQSMKASKA